MISAPLRYRDARDKDISDRTPNFRMQKRFPISYRSLEKYDIGPNIGFSINFNLDPNIPVVINTLEPLLETPDHHYERFTQSLLKYTDKWFKFVDLSNELIKCCKLKESKYYPEAVIVKVKVGKDKDNKDSKDIENVVEDGNDDIGLSSFGIEVRSRDMGDCIIGVISSNDIFEKACYDVDSGEFRVAPCIVGLEYINDYYGPVINEEEILRVIGEDTREKVKYDLKI